jgi:hypothetical protein
MLTVFIRDIFNEKHDLYYSLTGATVIFFFIGTVFGVLYTSLEVCFPGMIIKTTSPNVLSPCIAYSFYILSGQDPPIENVDIIVRNLSTFESIFANIYTVIVVGKLFQSRM